MDNHKEESLHPHSALSGGSPTTAFTTANTEQQADRSSELNSKSTHGANHQMGCLHTIRGFSTDSSVGDLKTNSGIDETPMAINQPKLRISSSYFDMLPLEIRNEIYKLLLVNPILGTSESVSYHQLGPSRSPNITPPRYDIEPQILRVSKTIYLEASEVLYGSNTFYIACCSYKLRDCEYSFVDSLMEMSPITRHFKKVAPNNFYLYHNPAITKVRHWKIVVSSLKEKRIETYSPCLGFRRWSMGHFCEGLSKARPVSLEIVLAPIGLEKPYRDARSRRGRELFSYTDKELLVSPLRMIRHAQHVKFRDAIFADLPPVYPYNEYWPHEHISILPGLALETDLKTLMMSSSPSEPLGDMYERLASYAQSFEAVEKFKFNMLYDERSLMDQGLEKARNNLHGANGLPRSFNQHSTDCHPHPVEASLKRAKEAWLSRYDPTAFKAERSTIVNYLEKQYKRVALAAMDIAEFVKANKRCNQFLSAVHANKVLHRLPYLIRHSIPQTAEGIILLDSYSLALERELPLQNRIYKRMRAYYNALFYNSLPRACFIKQAIDAFDGRMWVECAEAFRKAVDNMDTQYLQIRAARKALFEADIMPDPSCEIDLELWRVDEMIDWTVEEPEMGPVYEAH